MARCLVLCCLVGVLPAQTTAKPTWQKLGPYLEQVSRAAFTACDTDGDDLLDVFEAIRGLEHMGSIDNPDGFRRLDKNRDGRIEWAEFDRRYRQLSSTGGTLRIRPKRRFIPPRKTKRSSHLQRSVAYVMQIGDVDRDGSLSQAEITDVIRSFRAPERTQSTLRFLSASGKKGLTRTELGSLLRQFPEVLQVIQSHLVASGQTKLPDRWLPLTDTNGNGRVEPKELKKGLTRVNRRLSRWSDKVFREADENLDRKLEASEWRRR